MQAELKELLHQWLQASSGAAEPLTGLGAAVLLLIAVVSGARLLWMDVLVNMRLLLAESRVFACVGLALSWTLLAASGLSAALSLAVLADLQAPAQGAAEQAAALPVLYSVRDTAALLLQWTADHGVTPLALDWLKWAGVLLLGVVVLRTLSWWPHRHQANARAEKLLSDIDPDSPQNKPRGPRTLVRYR